MVNILRISELAGRDAGYRSRFRFAPGATNPVLAVIAVGCRQTRSMRNPNPSQKRQSAGANRGHLPDDPSVQGATDYFGKGLKMAEHNCPHAVGDVYLLFWRRGWCDRRVKSDVAVQSRGREFAVQSRMIKYQAKKDPAGQLKSNATDAALLAMGQPL